MKIMVTGTQGQVVTSLVEIARNGPLDLVAVGRPDLELLKPATFKKSIDTVKPDLLVNAAAYTEVDKAETDRDSARLINSEGPGELAALCHALGIPLIHLSTDYVFDGTKDSPYLESDPVNPLGVYGLTKQAGEEAVISATPHHIILRTAWVFSPFGRNFVRTMLKLATTQKHINVVNDQTGSPTYALHLAKAILSICEQVYAPGGRENWGIYHVAGRGEASWYEVACEIFRILAGNGYRIPETTPVPSSAYPTPVDRPANSRLDSGKLNDVFSIQLPDWRCGIASCLAKLLSIHAPDRP